MACHVISVPFLDLMKSFVILMNKILKKEIKKRKKRRRSRSRFDHRSQVKSEKQFLFIIIF